MSYILVTGGGGFIGSHGVKELLRQGYQPVVYDNLQTGHRKAIGDAPFVKGDLADREKLKETLQSYPIQAVIHFAADCLVGESVENPVKYFKNNVRKGIHLIEIMEEVGINKIVFSSSAAVYGEPHEIPITEEHPCLPTNPYGETKWIFERVLQTLFKTGKMNSISLRYFNAAGADPEGELGEDHRPETHLIPMVIRAALNNSSVPSCGTD